MIYLTVLLSVLFVCITVLIYQHRAFSKTMYAELREQVKATQIAVAQANIWMFQIAKYLKMELEQPKKKE